MSHVASHREHESRFNGKAGAEAARRLPRGTSEQLRDVETVEASIRPESRLVMYSDPHSMEADKIRTLGVYLRGMSRSRDLRTVMVTSALCGEGKSVTSLNLSLGLAERAGNTVVLVEADLRHPTIIERLGMQSWPGLMQCMEDNLDPVQSLKRVNNLGIYVLPAGGVFESPIHLLNSDRFARVMHRLRDQADWIILDCPPVAPVPDVLAICGNVDACLWVVRAGATSRETVQEAMQKIGMDLILGVILNEDKSNESLPPAYYDYRPVRLLDSGS